MSQQFQDFDSAFQTAGSSHSLRRRKTLGQWGSFLVGNVLLLPPLMITHSVVSGEGIGTALPVFQRKLWSLPIPGASLLIDYDGFDKLNLGFVAAVTLFLVAAQCWKSLFLMFQEFEGPVGLGQMSLPRLIRMAIFLCVIAADAGLFWAGLASHSASGWSQTPSFAPLLATVLFTALIAAVAAWHADFHTSRYA